MVDFTESRASEYQVILVVDEDDGRLYPLTQECPKCLLPVANRKLLAYQLDMLMKSGVAETFIVTPVEYERVFVNFLAEYVRSKMNIELLVAEKLHGTADAIRQVKDKIRGDFFCISLDFLSQFSLVDMVNMHRINLSDMTSMFTVPVKELIKDDMDKEIVGISADDGRLLLKESFVEYDGESAAIDIPKPLLHRPTNFTLRSDLLDMGVYLLSHWLLDLLIQNPRIKSMKADLLPYLLQRQYLDSDYLLENAPALQTRKRPLQEIENWLVAKQYPSTHRDIHYQTIMDANEAKNMDMIRCFALIYDVASATAPPAATTAGGGSSATASATTAPAAPAGGGGAANNPAAYSIILTRLLHLQAYLTLNREIPLMNFTPRTPWSKVTGYLKKENSVVADQVDLTSDKTITVKQCCIGSNTKIGSKSKLNNCVIMEGVTIGDNCTIQNCVLSEKVIVENNCNLNQCIVGRGYKVTANSKISGESLCDD